MRAHPRLLSFHTVGGFGFGFSLFRSGDLFAKAQAFANDLTIRPIHDWGGFAHGLDDLDISGIGKSTFERQLSYIGFKSPI